MHQSLLLRLAKAGFNCLLFVSLYEAFYGARKVLISGVVGFRFWGWGSKFRGQRSIVVQFLVLFPGGFGIESLGFRFYELGFRLGLEFGLAV